MTDTLLGIQLVCMLLSAPLLLGLAAYMVLQRPPCMERSDRRPRLFWIGLILVLVAFANVSLRDWEFIRMRADTYEFSTWGFLTRTSKLAIIVFAVWAAWRERDA